MRVEHNQVELALNAAHKPKKFSSMGLRIVDVLKEEILEKHVSAVPLASCSCRKIAPARQHALSALAWHRRQTSGRCGALLHAHLEAAQATRIRFAPERTAALTSGTQGRAGDSWA